MAIRLYVGEASEALGVPREMVATPLLAMAGAAIGNNQRIELRPGWTEYSILWACIVAPPGGVKTPTLRAAQAPLLRLQSEVPASGPEGVLAEHLWTSNATLEAVLKLAETSSGLASAPDELSGWLLGFDQYRGKGNDRQNWLSLWSGGDMKVDRKMSGTLLVQNPVVNVVGGIQPDVLRKLRFGAEDGMFERFLWSQPALQAQQWSEAGVSERGMREVVTGQLRVLRSREAEEPVRLSREAKDLWAPWYNENGIRVMTLEGPYAQVLSKLPVHAVRLALVLHCLKYWDALPEDHEVDPGTVELALAIVGYHEGQAFDLLAGRSPGLAEILQGMLDQSGTMTRTEMHRRLGGHKGREELDEALNALEAKGSAVRFRTSTGGRPAESWQPVSMT